MADEVDLSLTSFQWFEKNFPDDSGEPFQYLCWTLALLKKDKLKEAENKLIAAVLRNLYLVPHILGIEQSIINMWHSSNVEEKEYVNYLPVEFENLWDIESKEWLINTYANERCSQFRKRMIYIYGQLQHERPGPKRTKLVEEASELLNLKLAPVP